jgi:hypothetical protein
MARLVTDWPFKDRILILSKAERATLRRAAAIAERARDVLAEPDSDLDYELARLEHAARDFAGPQEEL